MTKKNQHFKDVLKTYRFEDMGEDPEVRSFPSVSDSRSIFLVETLDKRYFMGYDMENLLEMKEDSFKESIDFYSSRSA